MARVFLGRRSRGSSFFFLYASRSADFCFCEITVSTRAIEVRTTLLKNHRGAGTIRFDQSSEDQRIAGEKRLLVYAHLGELVGCAAGDLGYAEEGELRLELLELRLQVRLALPPELVHLDPGCRSSPYNKRGVRSARR